MQVTPHGVTDPHRTVTL